MITKNTIARILKLGIILLATLVTVFSSLVGDDVSLVSAQEKSTEISIQRVKETQAASTGFPTAAEAINSLVENHNAKSSVEYSYQVIGEVYIENDWAYSDAIKISRLTGDMSFSFSTILIAHQGVNKTWHAAKPEESSLYNEWLSRMPSTLVDDLVKDMSKHIQAPDAQTNAAAVSGHYLPWPGPHGARVSGNYNNHGAGQIDFVIDVADILATKSGTIVYANDSHPDWAHAYDSRYASYNNVLVIRHSSTEYTLYLHLKNNSIPTWIKSNCANGSSGQTCSVSVSRGQKIGEMGNTGWSSATHLHLSTTSSYYVDRNNADWLDEDGDGNTSELTYTAFTTSHITADFVEYPYETLRSWPNNVNSKVYSQNTSGSGGNNPPSGFTWCADEDGRCSFSGTADVVFGALNSFTSPRSFTNGVDCNNSIFGDPINGTRKSCYHKLTSSPPSGNWTANYYDTTDRWSDTNNSNNFKCSENINGSMLDKNYGAGSPCSGMDGENWVGDYTGTINFSSGNYVFRVEHDDGLKLWLNNSNIADRGSSSSGWVCPARSLNGNYNLRVLLREDGGDARVKVTWTTDTSFCNPPEPFDKWLPQNGQTGVSLTPVLMWGASNGANTYSYCVDTINNNSCDTGWQGGNNATNTSLSDLTPATTYYWQVRANNNAGERFANDNIWWSFTTQASSPSAEFDAFPVSGDPPLTTRFHIVNMSNITSCSWDYGDGQTSTTCTQLHDHTYNAGLYTVSLTVSGPGGSDSMTRTDYINVPVRPPGGFNKSSPISGAIEQSTSPTLSWGVSSSATLYEYCYDTTNDNACSNWISNGTSTSKTLSGLSEGTTYYWQVRAINSGGIAYAELSSTAFWSFTTQASLPPPSTPFDLGATKGDYADRVWVLWVPSTGATRYELWRNTSNVSSGAIQIANIVTNSGALIEYNDTTTTPGAVYYYWAKACNNTGCSGFSISDYGYRANFSLTVNKIGAGSGTVKSNPFGIDCGSDCSHNYANNTMIDLTASALSGSTFAGWSGGGCSGTGTCTVTMNATTSVTANFAVSCPTITGWKGEYWNNSSLTGTPALCRDDADISFDWGTGFPHALISDDNFSARWTRTVSFSGGTYRFYMDHDDGARLFIDNNPVLDKWTTCCEVDATNVIPLTPGNHVIKLEYFENGGGANVRLWWERTYILTVNKTGGGSGTVTSDPAGISCGSTCMEYFNSGTQVTLTAIPASGSTFAGWSGGGCSGTGTCTVSITTATSVTAQFTPVTPTFILTVSKTGNGSGTVTSSPAGINCGTDCSEIYNSNNPVILTATPASGSTFAGWSGGSDCSDGQVTMDADIACTATFTGPPTLLRNPSFEDDTNNDSKPDIWSTNAKFTRSNEIVAFDGNYIGRFRATDNSGSNSMQSVLNLSAGSTYNFSGRVNIPPQGDTTFTFKIQVIWKNASNGTIRTDLVKNYTTLTDGNWNEAVKIMVAPAGTVKADIKMVASSLNGSIYVDNFSFGSSGSVSNYTLTVNKTGTGSGTVTSNLPGINCGSDCAENYASGTSVTLTAAPGFESSFTGWSGVGCSGTGTCTVNMTANRSVTANFDVQGNDTTAPSLSWIAPVGDTQAYDVGNETIQLEVSASDDVGVTEVVFYRWDHVNLVLVEIGRVSSAPYRINFDTSTLLPDANEIDVVAFDAAGNSSTAYIWLNHTDTDSDPIFANTFNEDDCFLSEWDSCSDDNGDLVFNGPPLQAGGDTSMSIIVDDNNLVYVTSDHPNAETRYRARFYFDPNSITMVNGDLHRIFYGYSGTSKVVLRLEFRRSSNVYQIRPGLLNDASGWVNGAWATITDAPHSIEIDWRAATAGGLTLWIDGAQKANLTADNDTLRIDRVRLGAVNGVKTGTRGTYYFDAFESRRQTYIGP